MIKTHHCTKYTQLFDSNWGTSIRAEIGLLVDEIVEFIGNFRFVFCNHVPKGCNLLSRALASDALAKVGPSVCFEDYSLCL